MKSTLAKNIGHKIKLYRGQLGISQEELSDRAKVHVTHLSRLENGSRLPTLETLLKICDGLNIAISKILPTSGRESLSADSITREILSIISKRSLTEKKTLLRILKTYHSSK